MKMILFYNKYKSMVTTTMAEQTKDKDNADMLSYSCRSLGYNHHPQNQVVLCIVIGCIIAGPHTHSLPLILATGGWRQKSLSFSVVPGCDIVVIVVWHSTNKNDHRGAQAEESTTTITIT